MNRRSTLCGMILFLLLAFALEARPRINPGIRHQRYGIYHGRYTYRNGRYWHGGHAHYYHRGRYYPDRRVWRDGRINYGGHWYTYRDGRYWRNGRYYYYYGGRYILDSRRWRVTNGLYYVFFDGNWYLYSGGRYFYGGYYYYYSDGRYLRDDTIDWNYSEALENWDEKSGKRIALHKNPGVAGEIHYVNKRWDDKLDDWFYYRTAYRAGKRPVSGPHDLKSAQARVRRLNQAVRDRD